MVFEWNTIIDPQHREAPLVAHMAGLAAIVVLVETGEAGLALGAVVLTAIAASVLAWRAGGNPFWTTIGAFYLLLPMLCLLWLREDALEPAAVVLWLLAVVWSTDILAYIVGSMLGGPKLAPKLSPNKTWTGLAGGIGGAALAAMIFGGFLGGPIWPLGLIGAALAVIGQLGDLTESAFKRRFGVKDSSRLTPGQGGVLDRVDGLIFATLALGGLALLRGGDVLFLGLQR
jgi:phosphatidate cytidylyltransferase